MSILHTFKSRDDIAAVNSWKELQDKVSLAEIKQYLRAEYISKESHQRYQIKRNKLLAKVKRLEAEGKL